MRVHALATLIIAAIAFSGCTKESERGGPGAKTNGGKEKTTKTTSTNGAGAKDKETTIKTKTTTDTTTPEDEENTFTLEVPATEVDLDQGEKQDVTISINRGDNFKQSVKLQFKAPEGLKVEPAEGTIAPDSEQVKVNIEATADAPAGKKTIEIVATPDSGKPVSMPLTVEIEKQD